MAESYTPRMGVRRWTDNLDTFTRDELDQSFQNLEARAARFGHGTLAGRPTPVVNGMFYMVTSGTQTGHLFYADGASWHLVSKDITADLGQKAPLVHSHTIAQLPVANNGEVSNAKLVRSDDVRLTSERLPGEMIDYAGSSAPNGWLVCNGQAVSRQTYGTLFNIIGTTYGAGDGATTFNVPDRRGRASIGAGQGDAPNAISHARGAKEGKEKHKLVVAEMPSHAHGQTPHRHGGATGIAGRHFHVTEIPNTPRSTYQGGGSLSAWNSYRSAANTGESGDHQHAIVDDASTILNTGGGGEHTIMQPTLAVTVLIKT